MALILTPTTEQKIKISGTDIELQSVYLRLEFKARIDGIALELDAKTYLSKDKYSSNEDISVEIVSPKILVNIDPLTQIQDLNTAHAMLKSHYESNGYGVTIDLN
jgi:hypothetical protein